MLTEKKGTTVTPSRRLQAKGEMCTLQTGKLCYNAININYVLKLIYRIARELNLYFVVVQFVKECAVSSYRLSWWSTVHVDTG